MSNYFFLVHTARLRMPVDRWVSRHAEPADVHRVRLGWNRHLVIVSRDVRASTAGNRYFRGTALSPETDALVFGLQGWNSALSATREHPGDHGGEYCHAEWSKESVSIDRDVFGNARLLATSGSGFAAASDSLVVLASLRRELHEPVTINKPKMLARTTLSALAGQQMSVETMFNEIDFVPAGGGLRVGRDLRWTRTGRMMKDRLAPDDRPNLELIREGAAYVGRTVAALSSLDQWNTSLSLSGGYDSRVVFAAARATNTLDRVTYSSVITSPATERDFEVATAMAARFGMAQTHSTGTALPDGPPQDRLTLWGATLLGVYDGFGPSRTVVSGQRTFTVTGIGAELLKGNWGWSTWAGIVDQFKPGEVRDAFAAQGARGLQDVGGDPAAGDASELYYIGYRNGIHAAAGHIGLHMTGLHPLQQMKLAQLGHRPQGDGYVGSPSLVADLSILLDAESATYEYDDPNRDITPAYAEQRLRDLGGALPLSELAPLTVYGDPSDVPAGPSSLSISLARDMRIVGDFVSDDVIRLARSGFDALPASLQTQYEATIANAEWRMNRLGGNAIAAGGSSARVASLIALQLLS